MIAKNILLKIVTAACRHAVGPALLSMLASFVVAVPMASADDPKAREIMQAVNDRDDGDNQVSDMLMTLVDRRGNERKRIIRSYTKDFGEDTHSILFFLSPADVKDTGFLTYDYDESGKDDDQWLFLPALRKTKRIASSDKSGAFMGSDFNFSDLSERDLNDYEYKIMKEVEVDGVMTWQIESKPKNDDVADETGYSKSVVFVRQDNYVVIRVVSWVYKSRQRKYMKVNKLEKIDGIWIATELQMVTKEGRRTVHSTFLKFQNVKFNQDLDDNMFTVRTLEKGL